MLKNKAYWQVYNQKRKGYLTLKKQESRQRIKALSTTIPKKVVDLQTVVDLAGAVDKKCPLVVDINPKQVVDSSVVDRQEVVDNKPKRVVNHPILTQLIQTWKTGTNYNCASTCLYSYCNNCWYFNENELVDYKEVSVQS